jgi:hypothetical protein
MKNLIQAVVVAAALAAPVAVFAQNTAPLTRAQVRAELIELEKAGYNRRSAKTRTIRTTSRPHKPASISNMRWLAHKVSTTAVWATTRKAPQRPASRRRSSRRARMTR